MEKVRILKQYYRDTETALVKGNYLVQVQVGKKWKTVKTFEAHSLEAAQKYAKNHSKSVPKDEVIKLWR